MLIINFNCLNSSEGTRIKIGEKVGEISKWSDVVRRIVICGWLLMFLPKVVYLSTHLLKWALVVYFAEVVAK